jgi:FMN reductase (NADPH)/FMN reductase [NAD(P)H]
MEQYETHRELFNLPQYTFPICMLCFGYPTQQQKDRKLTTRFDQKFVVFENQYRRLGRDDFAEMFRAHESQQPREKSKDGVTNFGQAMYLRKFSADFTVEMSRSVRAILKEWMK